MATKRTKFCDGREKGEELHYGAVDRISKLPDSIIYHILSFLPTIEVVRISVLSKRWRRMWYLVPTLNLSDVDICINKGRKVPFNKFVGKCLKCRETGMRFIADSSITRFKLEMTYSGRKTLVDKWLDFVIKNKVEDLDLCLTPRYYQKRCFYCLPKAILNAQALTILKLENLKMEGPFQVNLPFLKLLFLKKVHGLNDRTLEDLLVNCPSLEDLGLKNCKDLSTAQVLSSSLKSFEVELALDQAIKIEAINLQCLQLQVWNSNRVSIAGCVNLKSLCLFDVLFDDQWFEDLNVGLTLESLTISKCHGWKHIHIKSQYLKNLVISEGISHEVDIKIYAPNLLSFAIKPYDPQLVNFSIKAPNLLVCNVKFGQPFGFYNLNWYVDLIGFLSNISCSKNICLHVFSEEVYILYRSFSLFPYKFLSF